MNDFVLIVDSREKDKRVFADLKARNVNYIVRKLDFGDYSFIFDNVSYEKQIVIERKKNADELVGNITKYKKRFAKEFKRAKNCKIILLLETLKEDIKNSNMRSSMTSREFKTKLNAWSYNFGFVIKFIHEKDSIDFILKTFKKYIREEIK